MSGALSANEYDDEDVSRAEEQEQREDSDSAASKREGSHHLDSVSESSYRSVTEYLVSDQSSIIRATQSANKRKETSLDQHRVADSSVVFSSNEESSFSNSVALSSVRGSCFKN